MHRHRSTGTLFPPLDISESRLLAAIRDYVRAAETSAEYDRRGRALNLMKRRAYHVVRAFRDGDVALGPVREFRVGDVGRLVHSVSDLTAVGLRIVAGEIDRVYRNRAGRADGVIDVGKWSQADIVAEIERLAWSMDGCWLVTGDLRDAHNAFDVEPTLKLFEELTGATRVRDSAEACYAALFTALERSRGPGRRGLLPGTALAPVMFRIARRRIDEALGAVSASIMVYADNFLAFAPTRPEAEVVAAAFDEIAADHRERFGSRAEFHTITIAEHRADVGFVDPVSFVGIDLYGVDRYVSAGKLKKLAEDARSRPIGVERFGFWAARAAYYAEIVGPDGEQRFSDFALGRKPDRDQQPKGGPHHHSLPYGGSQAESGAHGLTGTVQPEGIRRGGGGGAGVRAPDDAPSPPHRGPAEQHGIEQFEVARRYGVRTSCDGGCTGDVELLRRYGQRTKFQRLLDAVAPRAWEVLAADFIYLGGDTQLVPFVDAPRGHRDAILAASSAYGGSSGLCDEHIRLVLRAAVYLDHFQLHAPEGLRGRWQAPDVLDVAHLVADAMWIPALGTMVLTGRTAGWLSPRAARAAVAGARRLPAALRWEPPVHALHDTWPGDSDGDALLGLLGEPMLLRHAARSANDLIALHARLANLVATAVSDRRPAQAVVEALARVARLGDPNPSRRRGRPPRRGSRA